eukprot:304794-Hanusia_phi.AAC.3
MPDEPDAFSACEEKCEAMARNLRARFADVVTTFRETKIRDNIFPTTLAFHADSPSLSKVQLEECVISSPQQQVKQAYLERMAHLSHALDAQGGLNADLDCVDQDLYSLALNAKLQEHHFRRMCKRDRNTENRVERVLAALEVAFDEYEDCKLMIRDVRNMIVSFFAMENETLRFVLQVWYGTIGQVDTWMKDMKRDLRGMSSTWMKVCNYPSVVALIADFP